MKVCVKVTVLLPSLFLCEPATAAPTSTGDGYITYMEGGWVGASMRVQLSSGNITNPGTCTVLDGYSTDVADQGNQLFTSMLLSAYLANRKVRLTIDGCSSNRPRIIGVVILNN